MFKAEINNFFTFTFIILMTTFVKGQTDSDDMSLQDRINSDVTQSLTDKDLNTALSDLSLEDLKSLQEFIDSVDYNDLDYREKSFINRKSNTLNNNDFDPQKFDYNMDFNADIQEYNFESESHQNNLIGYRNPEETFNQFSPENQRAKRDDQMSNINEEYIKQLDYSFPQNDQSKNNNNVVGLKKSHVRVKRN